MMKKTEYESRFEFGANWKRFLDSLDDERIQEAEKSLIKMLSMENLKGKKFIDVGSGSGLFSLAARRLGAEVYSFDYDKESVACTQKLKERYFNVDDCWEITSGDVLEIKFLESLGKFDIVYSWGVLHHTGEMWKALENVVSLVKENGILFIAIYNDQGRSSKLWKKIKKTYCRLPNKLKFIVLWPSFIRLWGPTTIRDILRMKPFSTWRGYKKSRGMSPWFDVIDWVGGYPFEVAKPEEIFKFYKQRGFVMIELSTSGGGLGCNQYVFVKETARD